MHSKDNSETQLISLLLITLNSFECHHKHKAFFSGLMHWSDMHIIEIDCNDYKDLAMKKSNIENWNYWQLCLLWSDEFSSLLRWTLVGWNRIQRRQRVVAQNWRKTHLLGKKHQRHRYSNYKHHLTSNVREDKIQWTKLSWVSQTIFTTLIQTLNASPSPKSRSLCIHTKQLQPFEIWFLTGGSRDIDSFISDIITWRWMLRGVPRYVLARLPCKQHVFTTHVTT